MDTPKNRIRFFTTLKPENHKKLKELSKETLIPIGKLVDIAINSLLNSEINVSPKSKSLL